MHKSASTHTATWRSARPSGGSRILLPADADCGISTNVQVLLIALLATAGLLQSVLYPTPPRPPAAAMLVVGVHVNVGETDLCTDQHTDVCADVCVDIVRTSKSAKPTCV